MLNTIKAIAIAAACFLILSPEAREDALDRIGVTSPIHDGYTAAGFDGGSYSVFGTDSSGSPLRWDPCTPIVWSLNAGAADPAVVESIHQAVAQMSAASGYQFHFAGQTDATASNFGASGPTPLLIHVTPRAETAMLSGGQLGMVDVRARNGEYRQATVALAHEATGVLAPGFGKSSWGALVLHELGHVLGLAHTDNPADLMYPDLLPTSGELGHGDLAGLAAVRGLASCG